MIGGIFGLAGGVLVPVGAIFSLPAPFFIGITALAICEATLVLLLRSISRAAAGAAGAVLAIGVLVGAIGLTDLLVGPGYVAIGAVCWIVVAPPAAVQLGRARLLALAPASSLLVVSLAWLILSPTGFAPDRPIVQGIYGGYLLSWG